VKTGRYAVTIERTPPRQKPHRWLKPCACNANLRKTLIRLPMEARQGPISPWCLPTRVEAQTKRQEAWLKCLTEVE
jgi:hypothetical protein